MDESSIEHRLIHDHDHHLWGVHTGEGQKFTKRLHRDKQHNMNDRASGHAVSTHVSAPPPGRPVTPPHRRPPRPEDETEPPKLYDTATCLCEKLCAGQRTTDAHDRHGDRGAGGRDGREMVGGGRAAQRSARRQSGRRPSALVPPIVPISYALRLAAKHARINAR